MSTTTTPPVILITGCSTGFGRSLATQSLSLGLRVIATARKISSIQDLHEQGAEVFELDVTWSKEVLEAFVERVLGVFGRIDILINNAGYVLSGAIEENSPTQIESQFTTNLFGLINLTTSFLPHFRSQKSGTIVNISSQGAYLAASGVGAYCVTKAGVDCISEVWSKELAPFNIRVMAVNLGAFRTAAAGDNFQLPSKQIPEYEAAHALFTYAHSQSGKELGDPSKGARKLLDVVLDPSITTLPVRFALGEDAVRLIEKSLRKRLDEFMEWRSVGLGTNVDGVEYDDKDW